jgi:Fe-S-cluster containining protein
MDAVVAEHLAREPSACSEGCSYCCHVNVDATVGEVVAIARQLRGDADLLERLRAHVAVVGAMTDDDRWRAKVPCFFLSNGRCSIYDVRPLRCRAFHSYSLDACRDAFAGNEPDLPTSESLERACDEVDLPGERVTLESALLGALS